MHSLLTTIVATIVKQHPFTFQWTGNECCLTALHHLSVKEYANIRQHLITIFSGIPGKGYNDWSHAVPVPLGCLLKVIGAGMGVAHIEMENMVIYCSVLCLLVAGYLEIKLKTEQVAFNECHLPRKPAVLQLSTKFKVHSYHSLPDISLCTRQYKTRQSM